MAGAQCDGHAADGFAQPVGWLSGVAQDEARGSWPVSVPGQRVHEDAPVSDGLGELRIGAVTVLDGQGDEQVQPSGDALDLSIRQVLRQGSEHGVASLPLSVADEA